jgi:hypothetical protein
MRPGRSWPPALTTMGESHSPKVGELGAAWGGFARAAVFPTLAAGLMFKHRKQA